MCGSRVGRHTSRGRTGASVDVTVLQVQVHVDASANPTASPRAARGGWLHLFSSGTLNTEVCSFSSTSICGQPQKGVAVMVARAMLAVLVSVLLLKGAQAAGAESARVHVQLMLCWIVLNPPHLS